MARDIWVSLDIDIVAAVNVSRFNFLDKLHQLPTLELVQQVQVVVPQREKRVFQTRQVQLSRVFQAKRGVIWKVGSLLKVIYL